MGKEAYKKTEIWWLVAVVVFYLLYNLPGIPAFEDSRGALIHGALTLIPLWVVVYAGYFILNKQRELKEEAAIPPATVDNPEKKEGN